MWGSLSAGIRSMNYNLQKNRPTSVKRRFPVNEKPIPKEPEYVACEVCLAQIPKSASISVEADQYAQYFCGIECYAQWKQQSKEEFAENSVNH
jgi:hypothetical protein